MKQLIIILILLFQLKIVVGQSIPRDNFLYQTKKILYDTGIDWELMTFFGPIRFQATKHQKFNKEDSSIYIDGRINFNLADNFYSISGFSRFQFKNHYYGYLYPSFKNNLSNNYQFDIEYNFFNDKRNYNGGLGFENNWVILQFGRGQESWGAGNDIQLALSENSQPYNYFLLGSDYGKVRVRYVYGFLENVEGNINRYITARGFEWSNKKSFIIGFSETIIYSGVNRFFDIGYLNPISTHLETELNNRLNMIGNNYSNAVWQLHLDFLFKNSLRFSFNYLFDEFVIDPDIEIGKEHGRAFSIRTAYTPFSSKAHLFILTNSFVYIGTPTFRHGYGPNNFVNNNIPLGWIRGSDTQEINFGFNYYNYKNTIIKVVSGYYQMGEETILNRVFDPYSDYIEGVYPSGNVESEFYFKSFYSYYWNDNLYSLMLWLDWCTNAGSKIKLGFQIPFSFR